MIATNNYFKKVDEIDFSSLPDAFKKGHDFLVKATNNGESWTSYQSSDTVKKTVDIYLAKLNEFVNNSKQAEKKQYKKEKEKQTNKEIMHEAMIRQGIINPDETSKTKSQKNKKQPEEKKFSLIERIPDEIRFIKRFLKLNGKIKPKDDILRFINALQKAILEKRIRKTSPYAKQIIYIQGKLLETFNTMKNKIALEINSRTLSEFNEIIGSEKVYPSIQYLKKYMNMNGKPGMKEKAKKLSEQMRKAVSKKKITKDDTYAVILNKAYENLNTFVTNKSEKTLKIESRELSGIEDYLGCACQNLNGVDTKPEIMNSVDFANMEFNTIGLRGKWFDLIGDPSSNFTAMVFGKPKMGKSYLCIDFAGYLARNHGKVLYVAKEEGLDYTLQQKLNDKNVAHPNLYVSSLLPDNLSGYDFIFLDSVNKMGLKPEDLNQLKTHNPTKSFIFIFQSTKDGHFRGANTFQHDVDVVIEVPEKGKAVQMGRFNQGGEIDIFDTHSLAA
jgi:hypothetical protein